MTTVVTAFITVPATLVAAHWTRRSMDRAADAAVAVGLGQSEAAVQAARLQGRAGREHALESERRAAYTRLLCAADLLVRTVRELPAVPHESRKALLDQKVTGVVEAQAGVAVLGPPSLTARARDVLEQSLGLEKLALRRAVLRAAVSALETHWCPRDAEVCEDPQHGSAFVAWELLSQWGSLEDEERWAQLDFLGFTLRESRALTAEQVDQVLDVANSVACWDLMMGGWVRDPLLERFQAVRDEFARAARGSQENFAVRAGGRGETCDPRSDDLGPRIPGRTRGTET
ncbi:hypothetical protein GCM10018793_56010 [Streptomyces sulfonofaciens]|uniref:Uncharacterized protein n=1 Tax=Streptomyces sulfonofaciens TaxID=68272 RepID=A0A919GK37_9ACTN|nr:hypothetical protein GCM10018793_56010 [Streptomyces sulfonofaciens]